MRVAKLFAGVALIFMLNSGGRMYGQAANLTFIATFPSDVIVGKLILPKGEYEITNISPIDPLLRFYSYDRRRYETLTLAMRTSTDNRRPADGTKLILEKVGPNYYLTQLWIYGDPNGLEIPLPKQAKSLKKELKLAGIQPEFLIVPVTPRRA